MALGTRRPLPALLAVAAVLLCGCGSGGGRPAETGFERALSTIGGGGDALGAGYGWINVVALRAQGGSPNKSLGWAAEALGPGADDLIMNGTAGSSARIDPAKTDRIVSISGSYAFGIRFDGADGSRLASRLGRLGARHRPEGPWTFFDLGSERSRPVGSDLEAVGSLVARTAISPSSVILARSRTARIDLTGAGLPVTTSAELTAATDCLGPVVVARVLLNNFTYLPNIGPDVLALGVRYEPDGTVHEVFCAVDPAEAEADAAAAGMRRAFGRGGTATVDDRPIGDLIAGAHVDISSVSGFGVARANLTRQPGQRPGLLFSAGLTGELLTYEGLKPARFG